MTTPEKLDLKDPLGYDLSAFQEISPNLALVSGITLLIEALARRLSSYAWYDREYGLPLEEYVNANMSESDISQLTSAINNELRKDERVSDINVGYERNIRGESVTFNIVGTARSGETFSFTGILGTDGFTISGR